MIDYNAPSALRSAKSKTEIKIKHFNKHFLKLTVIDSIN